MSSVAFSGSLSEFPSFPLRKKLLRVTIPRSGTTLYVGEKCNDGRPITESWKYQEAVRLGLPIIHVRDQGDGGKEQHQKDSKTHIATQPWVEKYRPRTLADVIGHRTEIQQLRAWLASWDKQEKKGVLVTGPPGIGKTTVIHLLAKEAGYAVTEYNASDTRSVGALRGQFALGVRRLRREVIVMDEVDGLSERGGVAEVAAIIKRTTAPVFCIANERGMKLKPLAAMCVEMRFSRPMRSTIAAGLEKVLAAEGIGQEQGQGGRAELELLCERNGNDIRALLNQLEFSRGVAGQGHMQGQNTAGHMQWQKDACHRMEPFSVTQRLFANKRIPWAEATDLIFIDYHLIPLMVQEAYVHAGKNDMEAIADAAEDLSRGDMMNRRVYQTQDWGLLPHALATPVMAVKRVPGGAPYQIFPQLLGKRSKQQKHMRQMIEMARRLQCPVRGLRLDRAEPIRRVLVDRLLREGVGATIQGMDDIGMTREDWWETLEETGLLCKGEKAVTEGVSTTLRSALTREWNKTHEQGDGIRRVVRKGKGKGKGKVVTQEEKEQEQEQGEEQEEDEDEDEDEDEEDVGWDY